VVRPSGKQPCAACGYTAALTSVGPPLCCAVTIESTGVLPPEVLFKQALEILMAKLARIDNDLSQL